MKLNEFQKIVREQIRALQKEADADFYMTRYENALKRYENATTDKIRESALKASNFWHNRALKTENESFRSKNEHAVRALREYIKKHPVKEDKKPLREDDIYNKAYEIIAAKRKWQNRDFDREFDNEVEKLADKLYAAQKSSKVKKEGGPDMSFSDDDASFANKNQLQQHKVIKHGMGKAPMAETEKGMSKAARAADTDQSDREHILQLQKRWKSLPPEQRKKYDAEWEKPMKEADNDVASWRKKLKDVLPDDDKLEIHSNGQWTKVDPLVFRSYTGPRRRNGQIYKGPRYLFLTNEPSSKNQATQDEPDVKEAKSVSQLPSINDLVKRSMSSLRRTQESIKNRMKKAYSTQNTEIASKLQKLDSLVAAAIGKKAFGKDNPWTSKK